MEYFLFFLYLLLLTWVIPKIAFIEHASLGKNQIRLLFLLKVLVSVCFAYYMSITNANGDYLRFNEVGKEEYQLLLTHPGGFFTSITDSSSNNTYNDIFSTQNLWGDLRFNLIYKFIGVLNLLSLGNFYINTLLFCFITFFGHMAFYRIYVIIYPVQKTKVLLTCFLLPSLLLYTSCVHKDGIIFTSLAIVCYIFNKWVDVPYLQAFAVTNKSKKNKNIFYSLLFILAIGIIFLIRNYLLVALLPALLVWWLISNPPVNKIKVYLISYSVFIVLFFATTFIKGSFNLPQALLNRKTEFIALGEATTKIEMNELQPSLKSYLFNLPQAINHAFMRPYLWEYRQFDIFLSALEVFLYTLLLIIFIFFRTPVSNISHKFNWFGITFMLSSMLIIGYTIPYTGAIIRYRSIFWIFLLCPVVCGTDWGRIKRFITKY
jgi:hypothetical protein